MHGGGALLADLLPADHHFLLRADFVATLGRAQADGEINAQLNPEDLGNLLIVTAQGAALMSKVPENKSVAIGAMRGLLSTMEAA